MFQQVDWKSREEQIATGVAFVITMILMGIVVLT